MRLVLSHSGKLMSCWAMAEISGQLVLFHSGRNPLICVLNLDFNHRLQVWVLNNAPMLYHAAILHTGKALCPVGARAEPWSYWPATSIQAQKARNNR